MPVIIDNYRTTRPPEPPGARDVLCVDIGGTLIKAAVVSPVGDLVSEFVRVPTPKPATPDAVIAHIEELVAPLPAFSMISVGFPGVVHRDRIGTAPNLGTEHWRDVDFEAALAQTFGAPVRILNDAIVYGLGIANGPGRECVLTFGTGMGCALFCDGAAFFGLELGQHYALDGMNYDQYVGHNAFIDIGLEQWNVRAIRAIAAVQALTSSDRLFLGGGNARRITFPLPPWASIVPPVTGVAGGVRLWQPDMDRWFRVPNEEATAARQTAPR
jgi:polyphosphate glucokinase